MEVEASAEATAPDLPDQAESAREGSPAEVEVESEATAPDLPDQAESAPADGPVSFADESPVPAAAAAGRVAWDDARERVRGRLAVLQAACDARVPIAAAALARAVRRLGADLDRIERGLFHDPQQRDRALARLTAHAAGSPLIQALEQNPLQPLDLRGVLASVLAALPRD